MKNIHKLSGTLAAGLLALTASFSFAQSEAPNDAQIAAIVVAANTVDINGGKVAESKAKDKDVKAFAKQMVTDHTGLNKAASALAKKLKLKPEESATSKSMKDDGAATLKTLKGMKGAEFDKAYIDNEVTFHQTVLDAIDKTLVPNAKNAELKALLEKARPTIDDHLQHAKKIQASLK
jgi:putative membrane protein